MEKTIHTIVMFPKLQDDTLASLFLLRKFGEEKFPGIGRAKVEFWMVVPSEKNPEGLEQEGYLLLDLGGKFDHHASIGKNGKATKCLTEIIAQYLGVINDPSLKKMIAFARRSDLEGKGIVSTDPLDRAFGLPGILMSFNRLGAEYRQKAIDIAMEIFGAHVAEEEKRTKTYPDLWKKLQKEGLAQKWIAFQGGKKFHVVQVTTDETGLAGFLRAYMTVDIVVVRYQKSNHVNIVTNQKHKINLSIVMQLIREQEAKRKGMQLALPPVILRQPGKLEELPEWFYDTAANTIQNGGIQPGDIPATRLSDAEIKDCIEFGLAQG